MKYMNFILKDNLYNSTDGQANKRQRWIQLTLTLRGE